LRAFVPLTVQWTQQEMKRARDLRDYPMLAGGARAKSAGLALRVILQS
jgi:hypothetical protein